MDVSNEFIALMARHPKADWSVRLEVAHQTAWSAELRLTRFEAFAAPDVSTVFYKGGGQNADEVLDEVEAAAMAHITRTWT